MSYCRFSKKTYKPYPKEVPGLIILKSDVYVYEDIYGGIRCCGCKLKDELSWFDTYSEMIVHLEKHIKAGHTVPAHVIPALKEVINEHGDEVEGE